MRSTADTFCDKLRDGLRIQLQLGQMKLVKSFAKTLYSEVLCASDAPVEKEKLANEAPLVDVDGAPKPTSEGEDSEDHGEYFRGLGAEFKFPGDAKK